MNSTNISGQRILITGFEGFLSKHLLSAMDALMGVPEIFFAPRHDFDLTQIDVAFDLIASTRPDTIIHLDVFGGLEGFNRNHTADFLFQNGVRSLALFEAAARNGVGRIVSVASSLIYPLSLSGSAKENQIWSGGHRGDYGGYAHGMKLFAAAIEAYGWQYGLKGTLLVTGEIYGEFAPSGMKESGLVDLVFSQIEQVHSQPSHILATDEWPAGEIDLIYAGDVASAILQLTTANHVGVVNLRHGSRIKMPELIKAAAEALGRNIPNVRAADPNNAFHRPALDSKLGESLGLTCQTSLAEGLSKTAVWWRTANQ